ncbi:MAG: tetratricopeptide repeat protein [Planctomycetota bacterium]
MQKHAHVGRFILSVFTLALVFAFSLANVSISHAQDDAAVDQIARTAMSAQDSGDFAFAATQWESIIDRHPTSPQIGIAFYQAGFCYLQTEEYAKAADRLENAIAKLDPKKNISIAQAYLFLGFSQGKLGRQLANENPDESNQWLTSATTNLARLIERFPDFQDNDQALFFQADAFEALERWDDAAAAYQTMLENENAEFKQEGLFALASIRRIQGQYEQALKLYERFESEGTDQALTNEARFFAADSIRQLSKSAENLGESEKRNRLLIDAAKRFETVYQSGDTEWADDARFEQATCQLMLGNFAESAKLFESVARIPNSQFADQALVYAGRDYFRAQQGNASVTLLEKALSTSSPFAPEAAHWLVQLYLKSNQNQKAYDLAAQWIPKANKPAIKAPLLVGQADAAYALGGKENESKSLYLTVVRDFPSHSLAPSALYNAAYNAMELGQVEESIQLSKQFQNSYGTSDYLPDILEVAADSYLIANQPAKAEKRLVQLTNQFASHPKSMAWKLRTGLTLYLQEKYADTISKLEPLVSELADDSKKAEALHWIGSSQFMLGQSEAVNTLKESARASSTWRRADETLLTLARALSRSGKFEDAKAINKLIIAKYTDSPLVPEANYRIAEIEYSKENYSAAIQFYVAAVDANESSEFAAYAMNGLAWSHLQMGKLDVAIGAFDQLAAAFPDHNLATEMLIGRASAKRQKGNFDGSVSDIETFLTKESSEAKKVDALYELGLAQVGKKDWPKAIKTFENLISIAPDAPLADRFHYELAWAQKSNQNANAAIQNFEAIASQFPTSDLAGEANFHLAQIAYKNKDYDTAIEKFKAAIANCNNPEIADRKDIREVKEKALYKLAWSHYENKNFNQALTGFQQQLDQFPQGLLHAEAMFMVSESLYETNQFDKALQRYRVAKPIIETSTKVSPSYKYFTYLHGAQSANLAKDYQTAIEFAESLLDSDAPKNIKQEAQMELGDAYRSLKDPAKAIEAYEQASTHPGKTGARSMCMVGEILFDNKNFAEAINRFKIVLYGYGGLESSAEVKPWQAFAAYEAGRCNLVQISKTGLSTNEKRNLIEASKKHFKFLVNKFPNNDLVPEAERQLKQLEAVQ